MQEGLICCDFIGGSSMVFQKRCLSPSCKEYEKKEKENFASCEECPYFLKQKLPGLSEYIKGKQFSFSPKNAVFAVLALVVLVSGVAIFNMSAKKPGESKANTTATMSKPVNGEVINNQKSSTPGESAAPSEKDQPIRLVKQEPGKSGQWQDKKTQQKYLSVLAKAEGKLSLSIGFKVGTSEPEEKSKADIDKLVEFLNQKEYQNYRVVLVGHSDMAGSYDFNIRLSGDRAEYVKQQIILHNSRFKGRVEAIGVGQEQPAASNDTDEGRGMNRRVEIWLKK